MRRINRIFDRAGYDGCKHIILSALMTALLSLVMPSAVAAILTLAVGVVKEIWDGRTNGTCEWKDVVCDIIGIIIGIL